MVIILNIKKELIRLWLVLTVIYLSGLSASWGYDYFEGRVEPLTEEQLLSSMSFAKATLKDDYDDTTDIPITRTQAHEELVRRGMRLGFKTSGKPPSDFVFQFPGLKVKAPIYMSDEDMLKMSKLTYSRINSGRLREYGKNLFLIGLLPCIILLLIGSALAWAISGFKKETVNT